MGNKNSHEIKMNIEVKELPLIKDLFKLLEDNFKDLPKNVQDGLRNLQNPLNEDLTPYDFQKEIGNIDGYISQSIDEKYLIVSVNIGLKRIKYILKGESQLAEKEMKLDTFWIKKGDTIIWEW